MKKLAAMAVLVLAMIVTACSSSVSPDVQQVCDLITGQAESVAKVTDTDKMFALTTSYLEKLGKYSDNKTELTDADREALREALRSGRLDVVATDHAPHLPTEKEGNCLKAASGMPLVQFSLVAMLEMAREGIFTTEMVVEKMCHAPAQLYRIDRRGYIRPGYYADLAVVRRDDDGHTVTDADVLSKCGWTPFHGTVMHHRVERTFVNGEEAFANGRINEAVRGRRLLFNV